MDAIRTIIRGWLRGKLRRQSAFDARSPRHPLDGPIGDPPARPRRLWSTGEIRRNPGGHW